MRISILGSGSWATAIALLLSDVNDVVMWGRREGKVKAMQQTGENSYLPGHSLERVSLTSSRKRAVFADENLKNAFDLYVIAIPSKYLKEQLQSFLPLFSELRLVTHKRSTKKGFCFVSLTKGFENKTWHTSGEIIFNSLQLHSSDFVFALSGPSHAEEVALKMPTLVTLATSGLHEHRVNEQANLLQATFKRPYFKTYLSNEMLAVEIAGATKNIVAIAGGICCGLGYGSNTMAAVITRGIKEMERFMLAVLSFKNEQKNGNAENEVERKEAVQTLYGLAGIGDLIATAESKHSRNHRLGLSLAKGVSLKQFLAETGMVCEGANVVAAVQHFAEQKEVYMPITAMVHKVLFENYNIITAVKELMGSSNKAEFL